MMFTNIYYCLFAINFFQIHNNVQSVNHNSLQRSDFVIFVSVNLLYSGNKTGDENVEKEEVRTKLAMSCLKNSTLTS